MKKLLEALHEINAESDELCFEGLERTAEDKAEEPTGAKDIVNSKTRIIIPP